uniref:Uncharacterized protein n=1 Tax=Candidatus Kentrum sp. LFY TaxID=2126342 RepID=A0A450WEH7_9GAMM|nr:MAG: hypothetical protein BECKLFY1418C_GA0070996_101531 [Candidatus Kentron sp. LFY]
MHRLRKVGISLKVSEKQRFRENRCVRQDPPPLSSSPGTKRQTSQSPPNRSRARCFGGYGNGELPPHSQKPNPIAQRATRPSSAPAMTISPSSISPWFRVAPFFIHNTRIPGTSAGEWWDPTGWKLTTTIASHNWATRTPPGGYRRYSNEGHEY